MQEITFAKKYFEASYIVAFVWAFVNSIKQVTLQIRKYRIQFSELLTITACANCSIVPCTTRIGNIKGINYPTDFIY